MNRFLPLVVKHSALDGWRRTWAVIAELFILSFVFLILFSIPANILLILIDKFISHNMVYMFTLVILRSLPLILGMLFIFPLYSPYLTGSPRKK